jgi:undecaprenyl-phosphate alpha-N-acetylglucosaminyl 1-phosphatetransferase
MSLTLFFGLCLVVSGVVIRFGMFLTTRLGVLDHPGGHKQHGASTPFVGGFGLMAVVMTVLFFGSAYFPELWLHPIQIIATCAAILFVTGFADDIWHLGFKTRLLIQVMVAVGMVYLGGVELATLGQIIPSFSINLGFLAIPFTIFAAVGLINALNMIDGLDGLSGSLSLISLGLTAVVATAAQSTTYLILIVALMGGVAGFLYYNLRYPSNRQARVFLGDNGSMLLGFIFAWLFIALSQGSRPAMTPVTALWLFAVPLMDTISVMLRRILAGKSPFHADRNHLHHLFVRAGFRVSDTVRIVALLQLVLGAFGIVGWQLRVPEYLMFWLFILASASYFLVILQPRYFVHYLRRLNAAMGLVPVLARGVFVGYFAREDAKGIVGDLAEKLADRYNCQFSLKQAEHRKPSETNVYAVIEIEGGFDEVSAGEVRRLLAEVRRNLSGQRNLQLRLFIQREKENDRRVKQLAGFGKTEARRGVDRREKSNNPLSCTSVTSHKKKMARVVRV